MTKAAPFSFFALMLIMVLTFGACAPQAPPVLPPAPDAPVREGFFPPPSFCAPCEERVRVVTDQAGRTVIIDGPVRRLVSGCEFSTSAVVALGLWDRLVGVEARLGNDLAFPQLRDLTIVGTATDFDLEACIALEPDLVILPVWLLEQAEILAELGIPVILVEPSRYPEAFSLIASAVGIPMTDDDLADYYDRITLPNNG